MLVLDPEGALRENPELAGDLLPKLPGADAGWNPETPFEGRILRRSGFSARGLR
jgi:hypothetical protein